MATSVAFSSFAAPQAEAAIAEDGVDFLSRPLSAETEGQLDESLTKPNVDLRNFFPENWLFSLETISSSCLMR